jgi:peptidoglycan/LPS O-acetylase OafA/YrhL
VSHPLVIIVPVAVALLAGARRRVLAPAQGLALLALALQLRGLLDTWNTVYYALPACLALVAWEVHARRPPLVALAATALTWVSFELLPGVAGPDLQAAFYLAWSVPLVCGLALWLLRPAARGGVDERAARVVRRGPPAPAAPMR